MRRSSTSPTPSGAREVPVLFAALTDGILRDEARSATRRDGLVATFRRCVPPATALPPWPAHDLWSLPHGDQSVGTPHRLFPDDV